MIDILKRNNIANCEYSDEWYTYKQDVEKALKIFPCKKDDVILCPFDTEQSEFVKVLKERGHKVLYGMTDFLTREKQYECDYIITKPPFSIKDKVIEKCIKYGKPTTLFLPLDSLGGVKRHSLYKTTKLKIFIPTRRIKYKTNREIQAKGSNMHSIIMQINAEEDKVIWEYNNEN